MELEELCRRRDRIIDERRRNHEKLCVALKRYSGASNIPRWYESSTPDTPPDSPLVGAPPRRRSLSRMIWSPQGKFVVLDGTGELEIYVRDEAGNGWRLLPFPEALGGACIQAITDDGQFIFTRDSLVNVLHVLGHRPASPVVAEVWDMQKIRILTRNDGHPWAALADGSGLKIFDSKSWSVVRDFPDAIRVRDVVLCREDESIWAIDHHDHLAHLTGRTIANLPIRANGLLHVRQLSEDHYWILCCSAIDQHWYHLQTMVIKGDETVDPSTKFTDFRPIRLPIVVGEFVVALSEGGSLIILKMPTLGLLASYPLPSGSLVTDIASASSTVAFINVITDGGAYIFSQID